MKRYRKIVVVILSLSLLHALLFFGMIMTADGMYGGPTQEPQAWWQSDLSCHIMAWPLVLVETFAANWGQGSRTVLLIGLLLNSVIWVATPSLIFLTIFNAIRKRQNKAIQVIAAERGKT